MFGCTFAIFHAELSCRSLQSLNLIYLSGEVTVLEFCTFVLTVCLILTLPGIEVRNNIAQ